ncbi:50S ribosomal protein L14e [archaeon]|nr:50S ribosomal protein L14e [archaeon]MBT4646855.1 50S ribosomal protein L14e [archaeon]MBT6822100.1 50S ribosomal protein L14e [archaeon]MBT7392589.1 50S ribosomal protein L14e [archaeon]
MKMIDIGRICVKISGRDANKKCVIVEIYDDNYVLIDGETRRRKCNVRHLEPLEKTIKISSGANHADIEKEFKKLEYKIWNKNSKQAADRPRKVKKTTDLPKDKVDEKPAKKSVKKTTKKKEEPVVEETPKADKKE